MLKAILSISGRPGLFKLVSSAKNMIIVESVQEGRKIPIHTQDKVVSLGDISIYTETDEAPLRDVLVSIKNKEEGKETTITSKAKPEELYNYFGEVLAGFDKERVYPSDIKKIINWYNLLTRAEFDFETIQKEEEEEEEEKKEE